MFLHFKKYLFYILHHINKINSLEMIIMLGVPNIMFFIGMFFKEKMHTIPQGLTTLILVIFSLSALIFVILVLSKTYSKRIESTVKNIDDNFIILKNKKLLDSRIKKSRIKNRTYKNLKDNKNKFL